MPFADHLHQPATYARLYSKMKLSESKYLGFRDIPNIVKNHVKGDKALDYGCGAGQSTVFLKSLGLDVTGVDINEEMIKIAKSNDPIGVYNLITSGCVHSTDDDTYDLVFSSWVMVHVSSKQELTKIAKEIHRVLKRGGVFIMLVCDENEYNGDWLFQSVKFPENRNPISGSVVKVYLKDIDLGVYNYFWTENDYKEVLDMASFKLIGIHKPLGNDQDGYAWIDEKTKPTASIFIAQKM